MRAAWHSRTSSGSTASVLPTADRDGTSPDGPAMPRWRHEGRLLSVPPSHPTLARRLGVTDAVVVGLSAMLGAGVFAAFGPAARVAGSGLLIGLAIAAVVAFCNATSSARLAAVHP